MSGLRAVCRGWWLLTMGFPLAVGAASLEGFTEPMRVVEVAAAEPGVVAAVEVAEGDVVKAGQVLAVLDSTVLQASLRSARSLAAGGARLRAAEVVQRLSSTRLKRLEGLAASGNARGDELAMARAEADKAAAEVAAAHEAREYEQRRVAEIEARIAERTLKSPLAGVVSRVHYDVGEFIALNSMHAVTVLQLDPLRLPLFVAPPIAAAMRVGAAVEISCSGGPPRPARVSYIAPIIDPESNTLRVRLDVANPAGELRSGERCTAELPTPRPDE